MKALILKYLTNEISPSELELLRKWLKKSDNRTVFQNYIRDAYLLNRSLDSVQLDTSFKKVWQQIQQQEKPVRKLFKKKAKYALAASVALLVSLAAFFFSQQTSVIDKGSQTIVNNIIKVGTDKATLTTEDGRTIVLEKGKTYRSKNIVSNGTELVYGTEGVSANKAVFNYLTVPRGGEFFLKLADGTKVWMNSESQLRYPVVFTEGETRKVELVYGEAYFEVSPSSLHKGDKFKVLNKKQEIEVLGTEFNIKAYGDESAIYTTLVKGKISLKAGNTANILTPDHQAVLDLKLNKVQIREVDVYNDTAWKEGIFTFESKPLSEIMKVLSRWYDMEVSYGNAQIENTRFNGTLRKDQKIENVLETIKSFGIIKEYKIKNKKIELK
ncbi:FecR family protein [Flavobacterium sp. DGU38]|uniref:FecR family protein n=1 Tax=Flavobacterium calami TaxID=3139144 RepID=A0ABU9IQE6_9FLAO